LSHGALLAGGRSSRFLSRGFGGGPGGSGSPERRLETRKETVATKNTPTAASASVKASTNANGCRIVREGVMV